ncbi:MAG: InlB B-repeat-containing protein [Clostridiales bacterium]|nr:InlB B-repeat-containing protein [Clostridiales bacterium]
MKAKRIAAATLAAAMFATTCCGSLIACGEKTPEQSGEKGVYTITFDAVGGTVTPTYAKTRNGKLSSLPDPTIDGDFEFAGWYLEASYSGNALTVQHVYDKSRTIYAKWDPTSPDMEYTITFNANGGTLASGTAPMTTENGKLATLPDDPYPTDTYHRFIGWYTQQDGGDRVTVDYVFSGKEQNITVYAHYQREFLIEFIAGEGTVSEASRMTFDGVLGTLPTPTNIPQGTRFAGWYTEQNGGGKKVTATTVFESDGPIYAYYASTEYRVTFNANGGTLADGTSPMTTENGSLTALPSDPTPPDEKHRFIGWYTEQEGGEKVTTSYVFGGEDENITVYAHYQEEFRISFDANGGTVSETSRITVDGKLVGTLPEPTEAPDGKRFIGWYTEQADDAGELVDADYVFTADGTIYAHYEQNDVEYTVAFDANGGTLADGTVALTTENGKLTSLPDAPTPPTNCRFLGWYTEQEGGKHVTTDYTFTGSQTEITVYAHYQQEYMITFDEGMGTLTEAPRLTENGKLVDELPTPTAPTGYRFKGWYTAAEGGTQITAETVFDSDDTIYAQYELIEFIVTFDAGEGTLESTDTAMTVDGKLTSLPTPTPPTNCRFLGWYTTATEEEGGEEVTAEYVFTGTPDEVTIYARYQQEYMITLEVGIGTLTDAETSILTLNGKLTSLPTPTSPEDYEFKGWYTLPDGGGDKVTEDTEFTADGSIYAHYEEIIPVVSVTLNGAGLEIVKVPSGDTAKYQFTLASGTTIDLHKDDVLTFLIDGVSPAPNFGGRNTNHGVEIQENKVTVLADGTFTFYLRFYTDNSWWEVEMTDGKTDADLLQVGEWYIVGGMNSWTCAPAYHLGATGGSVTKELSANIEFKIAKCKDTTGTPNWTSGVPNYGYNAVTGRGLGFVSSSGENIKINKKGTYTITFNASEGTIDITSTDVDPVYDFAYSVNVTFANNVKVTLIFNMPLDWNPKPDTSSGKITIAGKVFSLQSTGSVDADLSSVSANDVSIKVEFVQLTQGTKASTVSTQSFENGDIYMLSIGGWSGSNFNLAFSKK